MTDQFTVQRMLTCDRESDESWPAPFRGSPAGASPFKAAACQDKQNEQKQ